MTVRRHGACRRRWNEKTGRDARRGRSENIRSVAVRNWRRAGRERACEPRPGTATERMYFGPPPTVATSTLSRRSTVGKGFIERRRWAGRGKCGTDRRAAAVATDGEGTVTTGPSRGGPGGGSSPPGERRGSHGCQAQGDLPDANPTPGPNGGRTDGDGRSGVEHRSLSFGWH